MSKPQAKPESRKNRIHDMTPIGTRRRATRPFALWADLATLALAALCLAMPAPARAMDCYARWQDIVMDQESMKNIKGDGSLDAHRRNQRVAATHRTTNRSMIEKLRAWCDADCAPTDESRIEVCGRKGIVQDLLDMEDLYKEECENLDKHLKTLDVPDAWRSVCENPADAMACLDKLCHSGGLPPDHEYNVDLHGFALKECVMGTDGIMQIKRLHCKLPAMPQ